LIERLFSEIDLDYLRTNAAAKWGQLDKGTISLAAAELDFLPPPEIIEGIKEALINGKTFYGNSSGDADVLQVIQQKLKSKNRLKVDLGHICMIPGVRFGIFLACWYALQPGDEAIMVPGPAHESFDSNVKLIGAKPIHSQIRKSDHQIDLEDLEHKITKRTKLLMLCNPHNPLGRVFSKTELEGLARIARKYNLAVLSNELYEDLIFEGKHLSIASLNQDMMKRTLTVFGFSKAFNLGGLRIGYLVNQGNGMNELKSKIYSVLGHTDRLAQTAAKAALIHAHPWLDDLNHHLLNMRNYCLERLELIPGLRCRKPEAGLFLLIDIQSYGLTSNEMTAYLEKKAKVKTISGSSFGPSGEGHVRITFATSKSLLEEALNRIRCALNKLNA